MLIELGLRNFKAFGDVDQRAPMSKITLIYGPTSGGKSSIVQAVLMLKQSALEAGNASTIWGLVTRGEYVDLGSYAALLHNHDQEKQLGISLTYGHGISELSAQMAFDGVTDVNEKGEVYLEDSAILSEVIYRIARQGELLVKAKLDGGSGSWWTAHVSAADVSAVHKILDFGMERHFLPELKLLELEELIERNEERLPERMRGLVRERAWLRQVEREEEEKRFKELEGMSEVEFARLPPLDRDMTRARAYMLALAREADPKLSRALEEKLNLGIL